MKLLKAAFLIVCLAFAMGPAIGQDLPQDFKNKADGIVAEAYGAAIAKFPCNLKSRGNPKMLRWQEVDQCLNDAAARVDWDRLSQKLKDLRGTAPGYLSAQVDEIVEASLTAQALSYEKVFKVKDTDALFPLTNSVLKFLFPDGLQDLPVFDKTGIKIGTFSGVYSFERTGGNDSTGTYKLTFFQYTDLEGEMQSSSDRILLDSFGVPWADAVKKTGFRLVSDRLLSGK